MPTVADLVAAFERLAPCSLAEPWDNVGLVVGDPDAVCSRVLLCIDLTPAVLTEAVSLRCDAVVAYHPPIFDGVKRLSAGDIGFEAARRGIAVYSPHTALDVAPGGTNDTLAGLLGLTDLRPLKPAEPRAGSGALCKLVTFVPDAALDKVCDAIFAAGAGRIGDYSRCSFRTPGVGTFQGSPDTRPAVGEAGKFELTDEIRIETVVPLAKVADVVAALRESHPYEEPAFDLVTLAAPPTSSAIGIGRVGTLPRPASLSSLVAGLKTALGLPHVLVSGPASQQITTVAICAGAGRGLIPDVLRATPRPDLYLTGELPHHDALHLARKGVASLCTLHSNSERPTLARLVSRLEGFTCLLSQADTDPFRVE